MPGGVKDYQYDSVRDSQSLLFRMHCEYTVKAFSPWRKSLQPNGLKRRLVNDVETD